MMLANFVYLLSQKRTLGSLSVYNLSSLTLVRVHILHRDTDARARKFHLPANGASAPSGDAGCEAAHGND